MRMTKPVLYKFAAPTARQKLTWVGTFSHYSLSDDETKGFAWRYPQDWGYGAAPATPGNNGRDKLFFSICANDAKDPADDGGYNQAIQAGAPYDGCYKYGNIMDTTHRPFGWDEWMKLYRKCYITGAKISVEFHGGIAGSATGEKDYDGIGAALTLMSSDKARPAGSSASYMDDLIRGGVFAALGNQNMKMKIMRPKNTVQNVVNTPRQWYWNSQTNNAEYKEGANVSGEGVTIHNTVSRIDGFNSLYKATKHILGLKTVYGDDNLSCNSDTNTVKRWSLSGSIIPTTSAQGAGGAGYVKGMGIIKVTFWCTFSSRRQVAQAQDVGGY